MAAAHPDRLTDPAVRAQIMERCRGYDGPVEFFTDRLASGVAQIAGAFFPRPVIVRFSDFKTKRVCPPAGRCRLLRAQGVQPG